MKAKSILVLSVALLVGSPSVSAQSFGSMLKKAAKNVVKKAEQTVTNKAEQTVKKKVENVVSPGSKSSGTGAGGSTASATPVAAVFGGENHTALFAPIGTPLDPKWGVKSASVTKPPKHDVDQPDWNSARPSLYELDNKSLLDEYLVLKDCMDTKYITPTSPAAIRYFNVLDELVKRVEALDKMVELYDETNECYNDDDPDERAFGPSWVESFAGVLTRRDYKIVIRSSLAPFATVNEVTKQDVIKKRTMEYFEQYGGFENAHKAKWTVVKVPKRK